MRTATVVSVLAITAAVSATKPRRGRKLSIARLAEHVTHAANAASAVGDAVNSFRNPNQGYRRELDDDLLFEREFDDDLYSREYDDALWARDDFEALFARANQQTPELPQSQEHIPAANGQPANVGANAVHAAENGAHPHHHKHHHHHHHHHHAQTQGQNGEVAATQRTQGVHSAPTTGALNRRVAELLEDYLVARGFDFDELD